MEIIDLKDFSQKYLMPITISEGKMLLKETEKKYFPFDTPRIDGLYIYDINNESIEEIDTGKRSIILDLLHENHVEGEEAYYFLTEVRQLFTNDYYIHKIDLKSFKEEVIYKFEMHNEYTNLSFEVLDNNYVLVFYKKDHPISFEEFEMMEISKPLYGYDKAVLYNIKEDKNFEVMDTDFLRGFRGIFFVTDILGERSVAFEENYLEPFDKEQIFIDIFRGRKSKKEKFFYKDSLKYKTLESFINEVKQEAKALSFTEIETRGITGYELFAGTDSENIYYNLEDFDVEDSEEIVIFNRKNGNKSHVKLPKAVNEESKYFKDVYTWSLENKCKGIYFHKHLKNDKIEVKEVINNKVLCTYPKDLGLAEACVENHFLITEKSNETVSIIDLDTNEIKTYNRDYKILNDYLILI